MDTVSSITSFVAPIIQHPMFGVGCFIIALVTIAILVTFFFKSRKKTREALKKKEIVSHSHPWTTAVAIVFVFSLSFGILASMMNWNRPGKITVLENGRVISDSKLYFPLGAGTAAVYDQTQVIDPAIASETPEPVRLKFKDFGSAETDYAVKLKLPPEPEKIKEIHRNYGNQEKLVAEGVKPFVEKALQIGAVLLSAHEPSAEKEKKLYFYVKDQLEKGHYVIDQGKIKTDETGKVIRIKNPITRLKIKLSQFKLENFKHEEMLKQLESEKDKLIMEFRSLKEIDFTGDPFLSIVQKQIEKQVQESKKMSQEQKKLVMESVENIKQLIQNLKEKDQKKDTKDPN